MKTSKTVLVRTCACGHEMSDHDEIAARFCRATDAQIIVRGCICNNVSAVISGLPAR